MSFWSLFSGLLRSKSAVDDQTMRKRSRREGAPLNAHQFARLDEAIEAHREMSGSGPDGARHAVERRAAELGVKLD